MSGLIWALAGGVAGAQPCPASFNVGIDNRAVAGSSGNNYFNDVIQNNMPCSATPTGPASLQPSACVTRFMSSPAPTFAYNATLSARWPDTAARLAAGDQAGCRFVCGPLECRVKSDGLPVELMEINVE